MMSSWKKVKRSGTFRRKVQKERDEMLKRALEVAEELKKREQNDQRRRSAKSILFRPAVIMNKRQVINLTSPPQAIAPSPNPAIATSPPTNNNIDDNVREPMNTTSDDAGLGVYIYFVHFHILNIYIQNLYFVSA